MDEKQKQGCFEEKKFQKIDWDSLNVSLSLSLSLFMFRFLLEKNLIEWKKTAALKKICFILNCWIDFRLLEKSR